ncbi:uncharacterized protein TRIADDRAFT_63880 [Trichoplax adhaerens]|uniref:Alpha-2-macroglobulin domain-containing protein n=1 Tax=Trichoplax adhaerens TaxID=10228 RepID=B3RVT6_TRIAD|nr:hypothetical protein TRIADDRAFT_63880 [Trichoplax adhaerens]EDV25556.1 hypothetical protein TRIADDRAFT_63880 [Trichoplax adhaerens]|eukprot:XP_002111589.1 hypothetical protein TRIADDRAFT_63880 [Trichoplax adhaerens]
MHRGTLILCLAFLIGAESFFIPPRTQGVPVNNPLAQIQRPEIPSRFDLGSYFIAAPKTFRFGSNLTISVNIYRAQSPVTVGLTLFSNRRPNIARNPGNVTLEIPVLNNTDTTPDDYYLQAFGFGGVLFNTTKSIFATQNKTFVFLQTDKKLYQPGQTGFISEEFPLTERSSNGTYRIEVRNETDLVTVKFFQINTEVLPEFDVNVHTPDFIFNDTTEVPVTIFARYPLNQAVDGEYTVVCYLAPKRSNTFNRQSPMHTYISKQTNITLTGRLNSNTTLKINTAQLSLLKTLPSYFLPSLVLYINVTVTESETGLVYNVTKRIPLHTQKIQATVVSEPESYKPGMNYQIKVLLTTPDGKPIPNTQTIRLNAIGVFSFKRTRTEYISENSLYTVTFTVPKYSKFFSYEITTTYNNETILLAAKTPMKFVSPSNNYLQLSILNPVPVPCNNQTLIRVDTTQYLFKKQVTLLLFSRGQLIHTNNTNITGFSTLFFINITPEMSPITTAVAFYVRTNGEVVNDILTFNVQPTFKNNVTTTLNSNITTPGSTIEVRVKTTPNAKVGILGIDIRALRATATNDITPENVFDRVRPELPTHYNLNAETEQMLTQPLPLYRNFDANAVFDKAQTLVFTDGKLFRSKSSLMTTQPLFTTQTENTNEINEEQRQLELQEDEQDAIKKVLPETWLWTDTTADSNGEAVLFPEVPNTVNEWAITTMSMSNTTGFGIAPRPAELLAFKHFFITTELPASIIRGEKLTIRATLFNFFPNDITVTTTIHTSQHYTLAEETFLKQRVQVTVPAEQHIEVEYQIIPTTTGYIPITLSATSNDRYIADTVEKHLLVKPQGKERRQVQNLVVDLAKGSFEKTLNIQTPPNDEPTQTTITFTGDMMRLSVENMDNLLETPGRCAEQNLIHMNAPVQLTHYLRVTRQSNPETETKARRLFLLAYQHQMKFLRPDGSFSPYGMKDKSGCLWLTAVTSQIFAEAYRTRLFPIDTSVVVRNTFWLVKQQQPNGAFEESIFTPSLPIKNFTQNHNITLTALVTISLVHNLHYAPFAYLPLVKARTYLEAHLKEISDPYTASIVSYALTISNSHLSSEASRNLNKFATTENNTPIWKIQLTNNTNRLFTELDSIEKSLTIQATSYALLTKMLITRRTQEFIPTASWLISQRNRLGGFVAAHDTCLALKALSKYAMQTYRLSLDAHIIVFDNTNYKAHQSFSINKYNRNQTFSITLPPRTKSVTLSCFGAGFVYTQMLTTNNVTNNTTPEPTPNEPFAIEVKHQRARRTLNTRVCVRLQNVQKPNPTVMELDMPSGLELNRTALAQMVSKLEQLQFFEVERKTLHLYFDKLTTQPTCVDLSFLPHFEITNRQPSHIKLYEFSRPEIQTTTFYVNPSLTTAL